VLYGNLPHDLGLVDLPASEMLFWLYCPIFVPNSYSIVLPDNLKQFRPIVDRVTCDLEDVGCYYAEDLTYIYLTAKTLWVGGGGKNMNRPGWHSDGFGTDDLNYIWSDRAPTEFLHLDPLVEIPQDCRESMEEMSKLAYGAEALGPIDFAHTTYPDKHLLRLDQSVIHRAAEDVTPGMRTFVKVSVSKDRYDLIGNSINHDLPASHWPLVERKAERNHPQSVKA
jgi:hypothetical protein